MIKNIIVIVFVLLFSSCNPVTKINKKLEILEESYRDGEITTRDYVLQKDALENDSKMNQKSRYSSFCSKFPNEPMCK